MTIHFPIILFPLFIAAQWFAHAGEIPVPSPKDFAVACAQARPGDTLVLPVGDWRDARISFEANGTPEAPITLRAGIPGRTRLVGNSHLRVVGSHLVVSGLVFTEGFSTERAIVDIGGKQGAAKSCRLTDCAIIRCNPPGRDTRYAWVRVGGSGNRVDHCRFEGKNHEGVTLQVVVGGGGNRLRIDHNHFLDRPAGTTNGFESLKLGNSEDSHKDSNSIVEYNLFESCDGEVEIISNKSCANVYRKNTFRRSAGALTLRQGDRCTVESNVFLGNLKAGTGGVRVIGRRHVVRGNYFHGLTGLSTAGAVIALYAGIPESPATGYVEAQGAVVENNVLVGNSTNGINLSAGFMSRNRTILPGNVTLRDNWIDLHPQFGATVLTGTPTNGLACSGNVYSPHSELGYAPPAGFKGLWFTGNPDAPVPLRAELEAPATTEHDGWTKTMGGLEPLTDREVGPNWWKR